MGLKVLSLTFHKSINLINPEEHVIYGSIRFYNVPRGQSRSTQ